MAFPLIPFAAGAAVGAIVTYLLKDREVRSLIERTSNDVVRGAESLGSNVGSRVEQAADRVTDTVGDATHAVKGAVEDLAAKVPKP